MDSYINHTSPKRNWEPLPEALLHKTFAGVFYEQKLRKLRQIFFSIAICIKICQKTMAKKKSGKKFLCNGAWKAFHETCHHWQFVTHWTSTVTFLILIGFEALSMTVSMVIVSEWQIVSDDKFHEMPPWGLSYKAFFGGKNGVIFITGVLYQ